MRLLPRTLLAAGLFVAACGGSDDGGVAAPTDEQSGSDPAGSSGGRSGSSGGTDPGDEEGGIVADLRADTNRDGEIRFEDPADDDGEDDWSAAHGAVFLANIDDDEEACPKTGNDVDLPKCNDAADDVLNGPDDALDLARLKTKPWAGAPDGATATISWNAEDSVRLFKVAGSDFSVVKSGMKLTLDEIRAGVELAIEGRDIVRDPKAWDGYVDVTLSLTADGQTKTDKVTMRVSPLMTYHHLLPGEETWVSNTGDSGNAAMREDLTAGTTAAGRPNPQLISTTDPWTQDFFETGFMSMPAPGGKQHAIRVNIRSANEYSPQSPTNPLRRAGRVVFTGMRGKDIAGVQHFDPARKGKFDTLNSFGNLETIPPYSHGGQSYPLGRILRGSTPTYYVDQVFQGMIEAQKIQPPVYIDTSWLLVGHVDETTSFVKAPNARGWVLLVNDATLAKTMLEQQENAGNGNVPMFVGKYWSGSQSAQATITQVLDDTEVMDASAEAAAEVDAQVTKIKAETGLTDAEIIKIPFLHMKTGGYSVAYQPGMVNGIYVSDTHFVAPDPHGPMINGQDIFKQAMSSALAPLGITVHFAEDWNTYHRNLGEVHCGTNTTRRIPDAKWWESGR